MSILASYSFVNMPSNARASTPQLFLMALGLAVHVAQSVAVFGMMEAAWSRFVVRKSHHLDSWEMVLLVCSSDSPGTEQKWPNSMPTPTRHQNRHKTINGNWACLKMTTFRGFFNYRGRSSDFWRSLQNRPINPFVVV